MENISTESNVESPLLTSNDDDPLNYYLGELNSGPTEIILNVVKGGRKKLHLDMFNYSFALYCKYGIERKPSDLDEAVHWIETAMTLATPGSDCMVNYLFLHGALYGSKFTLKRDTQDLEYGIAQCRSALEQGCVISATERTRQGPNFPDIAHMCVVLGALLVSKNDVVNSPESLEEAITLFRTAMGSKRWLFESVNLLADALNSRSEKTDDIEALEEAITILKETVSSVSSEHVPRLLSHTGLLFMDKYKRSGQPEDLDAGISAQLDSVHMLDPHDSKSLGSNDCQHSLCTALFIRYTRTENLIDLDETIRRAKVALHSRAGSPLSEMPFLQVLGMALAAKYGRTKVIEDLEDAIRTFRRIFSSVNVTGRKRGVLLYSLALALHTRYEKLQGPKDLEDAISVGEEALSILVCEKGSHAACANLLSSLYCSRYEQSNDPKDLDQAISIIEKADEMTPEHRPLKAEILLQKGKMWYRKYQITDAQEHWSNAVLAYNECLRTEGDVDGSATIRVKAARLAGLACLLHGSDAGAYVFFKKAVGQIPHLTTRSLALEDQQHVLSELWGISSLAASVVLEVGREPSEALEFMEKGRGIIIDLALNTQTDLSGLKSLYPELAAQYVDLQTQMSEPIGPVTLELEDISDITLARRVSQRLLDVQNLHKLEADIRILPGFETFQLQLSAVEVMKLAEEAPIVAFIISELRADAVLITSTEITSIPVPALKELPDKVQELEAMRKKYGMSLTNIYRRDDKMTEMLLWLWSVAVEPVFNALGINAPASPSVPLKRIYWVACGPISLVPIHAAGDNSPGSTQNVFSRVVSSYIPTIKALSYSKAKPSTSLTETESKSFIVTMPTTPGCPSLLAEQEAEAIKMCPDTPVLEILQHPSKAEVVKALESATMAHFACHGVMDSANPSNGRLLLGSTQLEALTVKELASMRFPNAQLAYLSACSTAENASKDLVDEVIHLSSIFQIIGFPHVIGTLWEADDEAAVEIAKNFYRELFGPLKGSLQDGNVSYALHKAIGKLMENEWDSPITWAPFVHFGV